MDTYQLSKEVSGKELVDLLGRASSEVGFSFRNLDAVLAKFGSMFGGEKQEPKTSATYRAERSYPEKGNPMAFDTTPTLAVKFPDINENARYTSVRCQAELGTMCLQEVDINQYGEFKPDYDALLAKAVELSGE